VRVSRRELDELAAGRRTSVTSRTYGRADGLSSTNCSTASSPLTWRTRDGKLWFATVHGLLMVDPERSVRNTLPPPVTIDHVVADGERREAGGDLHFAAGTRGIEFHYTGLSMVEPARVQFKYRLQGLDQDWIEAGTRRVAYYTNVPPGSYTFVVTASNNDGVWSEQPAAVGVQLAPYFHQTRTFSALCLLLVGAGAAAVHGLRVRRLKARERELKRRVDEAVAQVQTLSGLLPICAWCKRVRDDGGYWNQIESYISSHSAVDFTHGICPECSEKLRPGKGAKVPPKPEG
jgi:Y_Y_Y domain